MDGCDEYHMDQSSCCERYRPMDRVDGVDMLTRCNQIPSHHIISRLDVKTLSSSVPQASSLFHSTRRIPNLHNRIIMVNHHMYKRTIHPSMHLSSRDAIPSHIPDVYVSHLHNPSHPFSLISISQSQTGPGTQNGETKLRKERATE